MDRNNRKIAIANLHRNCIISAAEKLIAQKGYEKTTIDDISKCAEYSKKTIYSYFSSKEDIYYEIILKSIILLKSHIQKALDSADDLYSGYKAICKELLHFYESSPESFNGILKFQNTPNDFDKTNTVVYQIYLVGEEINSLLLKLIISGQNQGIVAKEIDSQKAVFILWFSLSGLISSAHTKKIYIEREMNTSLKDFLAYGFDLFLKLLV